MLLQSCRHIYKNGALLDNSDLSIDLQKLFTFAEAKFMGSFCDYFNSSHLSGSPAKSGPLDFGTKNNFTSFFVREKGLAHIYKKAIYYFPVSYFYFATSQNCILAELRLPTVIRKVKFTDFVKRAMSPKIQLAEFHFHTNFKVHSLL